MNVVTKQQQLDLLVELAFVLANLALDFLVLFKQLAAVSRHEATHAHPTTALDGGVVSGLLEVEACGVAAGVLAVVGGVCCV